MDSLPANIYAVAAVRETDRAAIEDHSIPGYTLMSRAGAAAGDEFRMHRFHYIAGKHFTASNGCKYIFHTRSRQTRPTVSRR